MIRKLLAAASLMALAACTPVDQPGTSPSTTSTPTVTSAPAETTVEPTPTTTVIPGPTTTTVVPTPTVTEQPPTTIIVPPPVTVTPTPTTTTIVPIPPATSRAYPKHTGIVSTTFWVGEIFDPKLPDGSQVCSTYDSKWALHWSGVQTGTAGSGTDCAGSPTGGCDGIPGAKGTCSTEARTAANGYFPTSSKVTPRENPFYLDLPYDDMNDDVGFRDRCKNIPWAKDDLAHCGDVKNSYMKNRWVKLTGPNKHVCYGQNEDAGPSSGSNYHDAAYVFGSNDARPANSKFGGAGIDVSPALNGCLGFKDLDGDTDKVDWEFVDRIDVPAGPWTKVITISGFTE